MIFISPIIIDLMSYIVIRVYMQFHEWFTIYKSKYHIHIHTQFNRSWFLWDLNSRSPDLQPYTLHTQPLRPNWLIIVGTWSLHSTAHNRQRPLYYFRPSGRWLVDPLALYYFRPCERWLVDPLGVLFLMGRRQGPLGTRVHNYCKLNAWALPYREIGDQCYQQDIASLSVSGNTSEPNMRLL